MRVTRSTGPPPRVPARESGPNGRTSIQKPTAGERPLCGCAVERRRFSVGESPTRRNAPAGSNRSDCGGNEAVEASGEQGVMQYGDVASVQAVTRVNAEQA